MRVAITGALSYTGRYLSKLLIDNGVTHITSFSRRTTPLTSHLLTPTDLSKITSKPLDWTSRKATSESLEGIDVLFCTYWIRFEVDGDTHEKAAARVGELFHAAKDAGVKKVVFSSHTRTSLTSPYTYIRGKALAEDHLRTLCSTSAMNYSIVRPCGIFGDTPGESILINNAAWVMRRTPLFLVAGGGGEIFQPVHVRDMSMLMYNLGTSTHTTSEELDACGPDAPTALELFRRLNGEVEGLGFVIASGLPTRVIGAMTKPIDWITCDVLLDTDDLDLLGSGLTRANNPDDELIKGRRSLFDWIGEVKGELGREYVSSIERYYKK